MSDIGAIISFASESVPDDFLECNGASLVRADYAALFAIIGTACGAADGTHFNIPDLRGKFIRGWDHAVARDPDRATRTAQASGGQTGDKVGTIQANTYYSHNHSFFDGPSATHHENSGPANIWGPGGGTSTTASGGNETRPINAGVMYCIKYQ